MPEMPNQVKLFTYKSMACYREDLNQHHHGYILFSLDLGKDEAFKEVIAL